MIPVGNALLAGLMMLVVGLTIGWIAGRFLK